MAEYDLGHDFNDNFLFNGLPVINLRPPEEFLYHGGVAGILEAVIKAFPGEVEERFDVRVPGVFGGLFSALTDGG